MRMVEGTTENDCAIIDKAVAHFFESNNDNSVKIKMLFQEKSYLKLKSPVERGVVSNISNDLQFQRVSPT